MDDTVPYSIKICFHCKAMWAKQPKRCSCGRSFFGDTHISNLPYTEDFTKFTGQLDPAQRAIEKEVTTN